MNILCKILGHAYERIQMLHPVTLELVAVHYLCRRCGHYKRNEIK